MRHENVSAMLSKHYQDVIETVQPPLYQDCAMYAMAFVVHIMLNAHDGNMTKVAEDLATLTEHALKQMRDSQVGIKNMVVH
jgi:hypothetical protein